MERNYDEIKKIVKALDDKKADDIVILDLENLSDLTDYFILCNGASTVQIKTICDAIEEALEDSELKFINRESSTRWILLDYGEIIIHIFHPELRQFYNLERLWTEAIRIDASEFLEVESK